MYIKNDFSPTGALEAFLEADRRAPTGGFVSAEVRSCVTFEKYDDS